VADFFTKPLQGSAFMCFQNFLLNVDSSINAAKNLRSVLGNVNPKNTNMTNMTMAWNIDDLAKDVKVSSGNDVQNDWVLVTQGKQETQDH